MKTTEQRRGWILCTDMTCDDILNYFARNFCVAIAKRMTDGWRANSWIQFSNFDHSSFQWRTKSKR